MYCVLANFGYKLRNETGHFWSDLPFNFGPRLLILGEKPYSCPTCPYTCRESGRLKKHIATHTGEKPYRCNSCHYSSTTCGDLKKHLMTHTGEKPFKCPHCPYSCRESGRLKKHMTTHNAQWLDAYMIGCLHVEEHMTIHNVIIGRLNQHMNTHNAQWLVA